MVRRNDVYIENRNTVISLVPPIAILAKMIEHIVLPDKYFYDSTRMIKTSLGIAGNSAWGGNYELAAKLFAKLNIFHFTTLFQWSMLLGLIFNIVLMIMIAKVKKVDFLQSIFALMCVGLCNIYIFNLGKDIIQFSFFLMCFVIIYIDIIPNWIKVLGCSAILFWESTFFREYYIIIAAFTIGVYFIISLVRRKKVKISFRKIILFFVLLLIMMYLFLYLTRMLMYDEYMAIMKCKENTNYLTASTMIYDRIDFGTDVNLFMLNYVINFVRMLFPVELLMGGVFYFPFFAFQVMIFIYIFVNVKNLYMIENQNIIALSIYIAFFMGSVIFEPDFGSFARHEAAAFPVLMVFVLERVPEQQQVKKIGKEVIVYE